MTGARIRVGINGFGRIGRCVARLALDDPGLQVVAVNDLVDDVANIVYLYNYDSTYGRARQRATVAEEPNKVMIDGAAVRFHSCSAIDEVPWEADQTDLVVDASGVAANVMGANALVRAGRVRKVIVTHSSDSGIDRYVIMGVNDGDYDSTTDHVVSATTCDANAIAHPLKALDRHFSIESGFVTTLHPWLSYQNLVDGILPWQSVPGRYWKDFSLGRTSVGTLIPKNTTAATALAPVLPGIVSRLGGFSYRVPTQIVSSADLSLRLRRQTSAEELGDYFHSCFDNSPYVDLNDEALVGVDFTGNPYSATIDTRWLQVVNGRMAKIVLWYDNEWGYSCRVIDLARVMARFE